MSGNKEVTVASVGGNLVTFEPSEARVAVTAHNARAQVEARRGNVQLAIEHADKAIAIQHAFVCWWDRQEKDPGGRPSETGNVSVTGLKLEEVAPDLDKMTLSRWRSALVVVDDPDDLSKYEKAIEKANAKILKACGFEVAANYSSESNEWYTPVVYVDAVRELYGGTIDLDPATCPFANETVKAAQIFTIADDALSQQWHGRAFMNPPYGVYGGESVAGLFCKHAIAEWQAERLEECVILINSVHSQKWQAPLYDFPVCFVDHRIQFVNGNGEENKNPTFQNIFVYLGGRKREFSKIFSEFGYCMERLP